MWNVYACQQVNADLCACSYSPGQWDVGEEGEVGVRRTVRAQEKPSKWWARCLPSRTHAQGQSLAAHSGSDGVQRSTGAGQVHTHNWEQSWLKLGWLRIGREITYMNEEEAVRTGSGTHWGSGWEGEHTCRRAVWNSTGQRGSSLQMLNWEQRLHYNCVSRVSKLLGWG